jgi:hypothetical protein
MAKFTSKTAKPKAPPPMAKQKGKLPERGQRTATHDNSKHPGSHDEWMNLGK